MKKDKFYYLKIGSLNKLKAKRKDPLTKLQDWLIKEVGIEIAKDVYVLLRWDTNMDSKFREMMASFHEGANEFSFHMRMMDSPFAELSMVLDGYLMIPKDQVSQTTHSYFAKKKFSKELEELLK